MSEKNAPSVSKCSNTVKSILNNLKCDHLNCGTKRHWETALTNVISDRQRCKANRDDVKSEAYKPKSVKWVDIMSAFKYRIRTGAVVNLTHTDPLEFFEDAFVLTKRRLRAVIRKLGCIKVNFVFVGDFIKPGGVSDEVSRKYFHTKNTKLLKFDKLDNMEEIAIDYIMKQLSEFKERGSGWALKSIVNLTVNINSVCEFTA